MINILKSSAGSGKTYNLARTYIKLLLADPDVRAYRHILAVTFTNKATDEMKSRIIRELDVLARTPGESPYIGYFEDLFRESGMGRAEISRRSGLILSAILRDYGSFSVSTIDKFFQQTLKSFARELGQMTSYQVELDRESLIQESVDRILDGLDDKKEQLRRWLSDSALDQLREKGTMHLEKDLYAMAKDLMSEQHRQALEDAAGKLAASGLSPANLHDRTRLWGVHGACLRFMREYEKRVAQGARRVMDVIASAGLELSDFSRANIFTSKLPSWTDAEALRKSLPVPTDAFRKRVCDPDGWFTAKNKAKFMPRVAGVLEGPFQDFVSLFDYENYAPYTTAQLLVGQIYSQGVEAELASEFQALLQEKNLMCLDDSNLLLRRIIGSCDAPFIYEKMGVRYGHFLLDEFQDTSMIQWENFSPLLLESDANGRENLVVGDVKQSVYRWRNSDWNLLASIVKHDFPQAAELDPLSDNYRSLRRVVEFNNSFFEATAQALDRKYGDEARSLVQTLYTPVAQGVKSSDPQEGSVQITFAGTDGHLAEVLASIEGARSRGAMYGDIAVLVRTNKQGAQVASMLVGKEIPVISSESLFVKSSQGVRLVAALLRLVDNPTDKVAERMARDYDISLPGCWLGLEDLCERIIREVRRCAPDILEGQDLHLQAFLDDVQQWTRNNTDNLHEYLVHWQEAAPKLAPPEGADAVRVMTYHKSKGLEFPYVIIPFAGSDELFDTKRTYRWLYLDCAGTPLEGKAEGLYNIHLSGRTEGTLFRDGLRKEVLMQYVDAINFNYVAFTRAEKGLHIICGPGAASGKEAAEEDLDQSPEAAARRMELYKGVDARSFSDYLNSYCALGLDPLMRPFVPVSAGTAPDAGTDAPQEGESGSGNAPVHYLRGSFYDFNAMRRGGAQAGSVPADFCSYGLDYGLDQDDPEAGEGRDSRPRAMVRSDGYDYFDPDGTFGTEASPRLRGVLLHKILSFVRSPEDLPEALSRMRASADMDREDADRYAALLEEMISSVSDYGWFPADSDPAEVFCERPLLVPVTDRRSGVKSIQEIRPDRVVVYPHQKRAVVVDYKFGRRALASHRRQVAAYASAIGELYGFETSGFVWYLGPVEEADKDTPASELATTSLPSRVVEVEVGRKSGINH